MEIHFAPLQGQTTAPYRNAHNTIFEGIDVYYTPFVRIERGEIRQRDMRDMLPENNTVACLIPQIIAANSLDAKYLIEKIDSLGYKKIDINMGCPFPMQTKKHRGSGILEHQHLVKEVLDTTLKYPNIKFSVKLRLGNEHTGSAQELLPLLHSYNLEHITLHPRIGKQQYKGCCDMEAFTNFYQTCKIPLIYNGDLTCLADIENLVHTYPDLKGIMLGRGLLANPALANDYKTKTITTEAKLYSKVSQFHSILFNHYSATLEGDAQILAKLQGLWDYLLPYAERKKRKQIIKTGKLTNYQHAVNELLLL